MQQKTNIDKFCTQALDELFDQFWHQFFDQLYHQLLQLRDTLIDHFDYSVLLMDEIWEFQDDE